MPDLEDDLASLRLPAAAAPRHRRRLPLSIAVGAALLAALAWSLRGGPPAVETAPVSVEGGPGPGEPVLTAAGYVVARRRAVVSAKIQGRLERLDVEEGSRVEDGAVFARLESADYAAAVGRARAAVDRAAAQVAAAHAQIASADAAIARADADLSETRRQRDVAERLAQEAVLSTDQRDAARSRVEVAEAVAGQARADRRRVEADLARTEAERAQARADLAFAGAQLQNTVIRAPFAGTVVRKMAEVGESVAPIPPGVNISTASGAIVALADLDTLEVEVDVAEANVARLVPEQPADVVVEAFPDSTFKGVLRQVIPTADRTRATVMVKVTILQRDDRLKPEMSAKVTFVAPQSAGAAPRRLTVPRSAILGDGAGSHVFVVRDGAVIRTAVRLDGGDDQRAVVATGLTGADVIVVRPPASLADGARVKVVP
ncbi:MAG: efflux RND transporter periplasmic adaptor subunit [Vicinamibacterales bacterium]